ncbi:MAG TPA: hypothetical protein VFN10_22370, partial [Thermoanaerobaculia bacterium]|nr:hypothetical protein [Thermoanaerobaculia bacterium]
MKTLLLVLSSALLATAARANVDLYVIAGGTTSRLASGQTVEVTLGVSNLSADQTATNIVATLAADGGAMIAKVLRVDDGGSCTVTNGEARCTWPSLAPSSSWSAAFELVAPLAGDGRKITPVVTVTGAEPDDHPENNRWTSYSVTLYRDFIVRNTNDSGAGSLREAIEQQNAACDRTWCRILFNIEGAVPVGGWFTIHPESPLPSVNGYAVIDGNSQTAFSGDTNPSGPEIEIRGDRQLSGGGIILGSGCELQLLNVAIGDFANGHAVLLDNGGAPRPSFDCTLPLDPPFLIANNVIGTDPRQQSARPNLRGIGGMRVLVAEIRDNAIANSTRSGVFLLGGLFATIAHNRITNSGASGIYTGLQFTDVWDNEIRGAGEFGVARPERGAEAGILRNVITGTRHTAIDAGLDLITEMSGDDHDRVPNAPLLVSASYDGNVTHVHGRVESSALLLPAGNTLSFYVASKNAAGYAQAEQFIAEVAFAPASGEFDVTLPGDLSGKAIAATFTRSRVDGFLRAPHDRQQSESFSVSRPDDTSELSNVIV